MTTLIEIRHPLDGSQFSSEQLTARYEDEIASMSGHTRMPVIPAWL